MTRTTMRAMAVGAALALTGSLLVACGSDDDAPADDAGTEAPVEEPEAPADEPEVPEDNADDGADDGDAGDDGAEAGDDDGATGVELAGGNITIPIASGWDEDVVVTALWKHVLEENGYTVDTPTLDIGPIFKGVATADYDFFFDTWLPNTHADYWDDFGDDLVDVGVWYENAPLTIAVPEYMDIDSMEDLAGIADELDSTITGIDPGAGLSRVTEEDMMPAYGLDDWSLNLSSTSAMLAALKNATDNEEPIVVTLWKPHWAYGAFPIKDLEDPLGAMGEPDEIHTVASQAFAEADPGLIEVLSNFTISDDQLASLEVLMLQEHEDDPDAGLAAWIAENQDYVDSLIG